MIIKGDPLSVLLVFIAAAVIPAMTFILVYGYKELSVSSHELLEFEMIASQKNIMSSVYSYINPVIANLETVSGVASFNPQTFKHEESRDILYKSVNGLAQVDALYVSYNDGYHRVVTRIDEDRRRKNPKILNNASWHSSFVDEFNHGENRRRHRTFFDIWPHIIQSFDEITDLDMRTMVQYKLASEKMSAVITEPLINPDTGYSVISVAVPIVADQTKNLGKEMLGIVGANVTIRALSEFVRSNQVSANSEIVIADAEGKVFAHRDYSKVTKTQNGAINFVTLIDIDDRYIREANFEYLRRKKNNFMFNTSSGERVYVSFVNFPDSSNLPWRLIIVSPVRDFVGKLNDTARELAIVTAIMLTISMYAFYFFSRRVSEDIISLKQQSSKIQRLDLSNEYCADSPVIEIHELEKSFILLRNALKSFSRYVPVAIVHDLISKNEPLDLGVKSEELTILFVDIENFSSLSENIESEELLSVISKYFSICCEAIEIEHGTIDKFIGDAVMAFWGAPEICDDHALRACRAALSIMKKLDNFNNEYAMRRFPQLRVRIGINTARVLVGNMGTPERMSYTAIGDGVNVASRLESMNKNYDSSICISEQVVKAAGDSLIVRYLDINKVKGRNEPVKLYELIGVKNIKLSVNQDTKAL